jgi:hypothetical protein
MVDKSQWPIVDPEFVMVPPKLERSAGRPRVKRIKSKGEPEKGVLTNAKDASSLGIVSRLLNSLLNCHRQLLLIQGKLTPYTFAVT